MMLIHIGQPEVAEKVMNAWLTTIEDGIHTGDVFGAHSKEKVGTREFADAVIARLGKTPTTLAAVNYTGAKKQGPAKAQAKVLPAKKELVGSDIFIGWNDAPQKLGDALAKIPAGNLSLKMLSCKGLKVWPEAGSDDMHLTDQFRSRFRAADGKTTTHAEIVALLSAIAAAGFDITKTENLYTFDGVPGFSLGQGE